MLRDPEPDRAPARLVRLVRRPGAARAVRRDQPDPGLHRQGDGAPVPGLRVRGAQVLRARVPDQQDQTFSKPLYVNVELLIKETGEIQRQQVYFGDFPLMTDQGTFIINGAERVVVEPARPVARRLLQRKVEDPSHRPRPLRGQGDPEPRRLARVRDADRGAAVRQGRSQAQDRRDQAPACGRRYERERLGSRTGSPASPTNREQQYIASTLEKDPTTTRPRR